MHTPVLYSVGTLQQCVAAIEISVRASIALRRRRDVIHTPVLYGVVILRSNNVASSGPNRFCCADRYRIYCHTFTTGQVAGESEVE